jgi:cell division protein FtsL
LLRAIETSVLARLVTAMALFAVAGLLYLAQASQVSVHEFNIADLQQQQATLTMQNASLHAQATSLQSPDRIAQIAGTRLHMAPPDLSRAIWITPVLPTVAPVPGSDADTEAAMQGSEPAAWMQRLVTLIQSSL